MKRKGIILAGGSGTRLYPLTIAVSKQLLPVYDKPLIYYPITILMLSGIREILIITTQEHQEQFKKLLGNGSQWGIELSYKTQPRPDGLAQAFILGESFLKGAPSCLVLGDNIFFGHGLSKILKNVSKKKIGATIFGYHVNEPEHYGVIGFDNAGIVNSIVEKPTKPASKYAVTGLYFVDETAPERAKSIKPSKRGEIEITSLLESYLSEDNLSLEKMGRGFAWFDTGTVKSLLDASEFVQAISERQGLQVGSPDEIAYKFGWINDKKFNQLLAVYKNSAYGKYLTNIIENKT